MPFLRQHGLGGFARVLQARMRSLMGVRAAASFAACDGFFRGKSGIEVGGPSEVFSRRGMYPVYAIAAGIDNCNFGATTTWEGEIREGQNFRFDREKAAGMQYISEATDMHRIAAGVYDFVLASHVLEHVANPILALSEWKRILKESGTLVLVLPHKDHTFDHRRQVTALEHLIADQRNQVAEDDLTHLPEILALHDLARDPEAGDLAAFRERSARNVENRCLHHHVFDTRLGVDLLECVGMQVLVIEEAEPPHILIVARKSPAGRPTAPMIDR